MNKNCNKNYQKSFDEHLKKKSPNTHKFSNHDSKKIILLVETGIYLYKYIDNWKKFNETSLSEKEDFYSHLKMEDITDSGYDQAKEIYKYL